MSERRISFVLWFLKSTVFVIVYAFVAIFLYDIVADIHLTEPHTLFTPIDKAIPFISLFAIPYVFITYPFVLYTFGYFAYIKPQRMNRYFVSILIIYIISYITYIIFPVMMIRPDP